MTSAILDFLAATLRIATPLLFAATGEVIAERAGILNLGIEGTMLIGALTGALVSMVGGATSGILAAVAIGALVGAGVALLVVRGRADQVIAGTAVTLGGIGITGAVYRATLGNGSARPTIPTLAAPWILTIVAFAGVGVAHWTLFHTRWGLALRATGEDRRAALANGVAVDRVQSSAVIIASAFAALGGASLVLAQVGSFAEKMTAGRGFIAIAIVVLGRWRPFGILGAALLFGGLQALQFLLQGLGSELPYQLFLVLPYLFTLVALAGIVGRTRAPAGLGK